MLEQVEETIFTLFTVNVGSEVAVDVVDPVVADALALDVSPHTLTSCPTWSDSLEVSPASWYLVPAASVRVKLPAEPFRQPSMAFPFSLPVLDAAEVSGCCAVGEVVLGLVVVGFCVLGCVLLGFWELSVVDGLV